MTTNGSSMNSANLRGNAKKNYFNILFTFLNILLTALLWSIELLLAVFQTITLSLHNVEKLHQTWVDVVINVTLMHGPMQERKRKK